jgi:hypothetical protein
MTALQFINNAHINKHYGFIVLIICLFILPYYLDLEIFSPGRIIIISRP